MRYQIVNIVLTNNSSPEDNFKPKTFLAFETDSLQEACLVLTRHRQSNMGKTVLLSDNLGHGKIVSIEAFNGNEWITDDLLKNNPKS